MFFPTTILIEIMAGQTLRQGWDRGQAILSLLAKGRLEGGEARVEVNFCGEQFWVYPGDILPFEHWEALVLKYASKG